MFDIIDYANRKKVPEAVLSIDLCKAFDSLKWSFIFEMLKLYRFGSKIRNWIKILYKKPKCRVINNNYLSHFSTLKKGKTRRPFVSYNFCTLHRILGSDVTTK